MKRLALVMIAAVGIGRASGLAQTRSAAPMQTLTYTATGPGTIALDPKPAGALVSVPAAQGTASYPKGTVVTLTATPNVALRVSTSFAGWTGACAGTNPVCKITMDGPKTVGANFVSKPAGPEVPKATPGPTHTLTVLMQGAGGSVDSSPSGISCGGTPFFSNPSCTATYPAGTTVTLTATLQGPNTKIVWGSGSSSCQGSGLTCTVTLGADTKVQAAFLGFKPNFMVQISGSGSGIITSDPSGISCPGTCEAAFAPGSTVTLTGNVAGGSTVVWKNCDVILLKGTNCKVTIPTNTVKPFSPYVVSATIVSAAQNLPDLAVTDVRVGPDQYDIIVSLRNAGPVAAPATSVQIACDKLTPLGPCSGKTIYEVKSLAPGEDAVIHMPVTFGNLTNVSGKAGHWVIVELSATADPNNLINELDKANNTMKIKVPVGVQEK